MYIYSQTFELGHVSAKFIGHTFDARSVESEELERPTALQRWEFTQFLKVGQDAFRGGEKKFQTVEYNISI